MDTTSETNGTATPIAPGDLTGPLIAGMPPVTEALPPITDAASFASAPGENGNTVIPEIIRQTEPTARTGQSGIIDKNGIEFDPAYHAAENGIPKKNKFGSFYKKRGIEGTATFEQGDNGVSPQQKLRAEKIAKVVTRMIDRAGRAILTEDAKLTDEEKSESELCLKEYLETTGAKDIPPGLTCALVFGTIYASKLEKPTVRDRIVMLALKAKRLFTGKTL